MAPIGSRHAEVVDRLGRCLHEAVGKLATTSVQRPIRLDDLSEPQPDLVLLQPRSYADAHPAPSDVLLVIEVSDSTRQKGIATAAADTAAHPHTQ